MMMMFTRGLRQSNLIAVSFLLMSPAMASAQAAAEHAAATAKMGAAGVQATKVKEALVQTLSQKAPKSPHMVARTQEPMDVVNRRALQERAGKDASKLFLRSEPNGAQVWINGNLVGSTPLLVVLAPGRYRVEIIGSRMETGQWEIDLLPNEKREVVLIPQPRYPTSIRLR